MPNWCDNAMKVRGRRRELKKFLTEVMSVDEYRRQYLDFEKIVPLGDPGDDWLDKRIDNWGTKWNLDGCDFALQDEGTHLEIWFLTAWSPPVPVMGALTKKYPELSFRLDYSECGTGFRGVFESEKGEVLKDRCWNMTPKELVELGYADAEDEEDDDAG